MRFSRLRVWFTNLLIPVWIALYILLFRAWAVLLILPFIVAWGPFWTTFLIFLAYAVWGTIFYLLILRKTVFDRARKRLAGLVPKSENRFLSWIKRTLLRQDPILISPWIILLNFAFFGVLGSIILVRLSYPRKLFFQGMVLVWVGCAVEVLTWFFPIYFGLLSALSAFLQGFLGIAF